jgi:hypothetical protein
MPNLDARCSPFGRPRGGVSRARRRGRAHTCCCSRDRCTQAPRRRSP